MMACVVVCEHCQAPVNRHHQTTLEGYSYHEKCRKCYVCSETNLHGAEVFKGVIFCSSCSQRIFKGCSTARKNKDTARNREKYHRRRSHRTKEKPRTGHPTGILALTGLLASTDTSGRSADTELRSRSSETRGSQHSKPIVVSAKMALTGGKPNYHETKNFKRSSAEVGMTTEVTQQLLKELNCPVVTRHHQKKSSPITPSASSPLKKKSPCSDLRVAELGTSREIANMALRHKNEMPVIIKTESRAKPMTSTSDSILNRESESGDRHDEWMESAYSTLDDSAKTQVLDRSWRSILRIPFFAFKTKILNKSSLINDLMSAKDSLCVLKKIKTAFHHECTGHQRRGLNPLFSTINRKKVPNKLGWLNLVTNIYCKHSDSVHRFSRACHQKRCKHFRTSHSYRCMRAQAMKLAGPTKSELAILRRRLRNLIAPSFVRNIAITYFKKSAIMMSHSCGSSKVASLPHSHVTETNIE